ncbi:hypothetical protein [Moraxella lacunata]|jgi:hypothetical protein|uniref:hypothetical protein n=1 Tax=Moraxella lacunata TaxID=477 RepID=UPI003EDF7EE2
MGEYLAHWMFALFMIDCVGILAYVLLFNNVKSFIYTIILISLNKYSNPKK